MNPSDHELNAVLARVADVDVYENEHPSVTCWWWSRVIDYKQVVSTWNPLHDANQMDMVEEIVSKTMDIEYTKYVESEVWGVSVWNTNSQFDGADKSRKRAFALAVYAMEQAQKGTT